MRTKWAVLSLIAAALVASVMACSAGGSASNTPVGVPYNIDTRALPTADDIDTLIPPTVGAFTRTSVSGQLTGGLEAYGQYTSPQGDAFLTVSIADDTAGAQSGVATAKSEVSASAPANTPFTESLNTDPAYFLMNQLNAVFFAWSHGKYYFSLDPNSSAEVLDAFMASYPY